MKCEHCKYEWTTRTQKPKMCPRCHRRLDYQYKTCQKCGTNIGKTELKHQKYPAYCIPCGELIRKEYELALNNTK